MSLYSCDAALTLRAQGATAENIISGLVLVPEQIIQSVCEPAENKRHPVSFYDAQFSMPFLISAALVRGRLSMAELDADALHDAEILSLTRRIGYEVDPNSAFPRAYSGELRLTLSDGRVLTHREQINRGAPERPLMNVDIVEKYRLNAMSAVSAQRLGEVEEAILSLDTDRPVAELATLIGG